jgi:hypothetical protein
MKALFTITDGDYTTTITRTPDESYSVRIFSWHNDEEISRHDTMVAAVKAVIEGLKFDMMNGRYDEENYT